jgi:iron-sulfur cluster repair protein YtfE (RIC family)
MLGVHEQPLNDFHHQLDERLATLIYDARTGDERPLRACFASLETDLRRHMDEEERELLPAFAAEYPVEAAAIRAEHEEIRRLLADLGVGLDLRLFRLETAEALALQLRAHAMREEALMYPWAQRRS